MSRSIWEGKGPKGQINQPWQHRSGTPHSPLHKDIPDAARQVAKSAGPWQTAQLKQHLLLLAPMPPVVMGPLLGPLELVIYVKPNPAMGAWLVIHSAQVPPATRQCLPAARVLLYRNVPRGVAVDGDVVAGIIRVGMFCGEFGFQNCHGYSAILQRHLTIPFLKR